jgi:hypothetical protein
VPAWKGEAVHPGAPGSQCVYRTRFYRIPSVLSLYEIDRYKPRNNKNSRANASNTSTFPERAPAQRTPEPSHQACSRTLAGGSSEKARSIDTRGHGHAGTHFYSKQGRSTLGTELNTAWGSARGQLNEALQVSASAPSARLREVQVGMTATAKDGARSRAWEARRSRGCLWFLIGPKGPHVMPLDAFGNGRLWFVAKQ